MISHIKIPYINKQLFLKENVYFILRFSKTSLSTVTPLTLLYSCLIALKHIPPNNIYIGPLCFYFYFFLKQHFFF